MDIVTKRIYIYEGITGTQTTPNKQNITCGTKTVFGREHIGRELFMNRTGGSHQDPCFQSPVTIFDVVLPSGAKSQGYMVEF